MVPHTRAENELWESIFVASANGWGAVKRQEDPDSADALAELKLRVYLVNTHTGWASTMVTHVRALHCAHQMVSKSPALRAQARHECIARIIAAGNAPSAGDQRTLAEAFEAALRDLAASATYERILTMNEEGLAGHWMVLVYRLEDGSYISRPMFWNSPQDDPMLLSPEELANQVRTALRFDRKLRETRIGVRIQQGGGLQAHPMYA